jgi:HK97 family phage major capsid protein
VAFLRDGPAGFVPEGGEIPLAGPGLDEATIFTGKVAILARLSNEQFGQPQTAEQMAASFGRSLTRAADAAFLSQPAPTPPAVNPPAGLLAVPGIVNGGEIAGNLDSLTDGLALLETNLSRPTHIVCGPLAWGYLRKFRIGDQYNSTLLGSGTADAVRMLLGLPVMVNPCVPADALVVIDKSVIVSALGMVRVSISEHEQFSSDVTVLRAAWRFGAALTFPERIAKFTVANPSGE